MHEREAMFSNVPFLSRSWRRRRRQERRFALGLPEMSRAETGLLRRLIQGAGTMVEYGSGTSTFFALSCGVRRLVSVESDPAWLARLRDDRRCAEAEASGRLVLLHADIGPVRDRGYPINDRRKDIGTTYASAPWPACDHRADVVLVDGRFRVACALRAALESEAPAMILIHDYANRPYYHVIADHLPMVTQSGRLAVFESRLHDVGQAREAAAAYLLDPR